MWRWDVPSLRGERIDKLFSMNGNFCFLNDRFLENKRRLSSPRWFNPNYLGVKIYNYVNMSKAKKATSRS